MKKWDKGANALLSFIGMHCVRHSSIVEARGQGGEEAAVRRGAHETNAMLEHYSRGNPQRVVAVTKMLARRERTAELRKQEVRVRPLKSEVKHERRHGAGKTQERRPAFRFLSVRASRAAGRG